MFQFVSYIWIFFFLCLLSVEDLLERQISMKWIGILGITGLIYVFKMEHMPVFFPGIFLFLVSFFTREQIGYGDAFLVLVLGMWMNMGQLCYMLWTAAILSFVVAVCFQKKELPFVPFLTIGYVIGVLR